MSKSIEFSCPACESREIRYKALEKHYYCRRCGCVFKVNSCTTGIQYYVLYSPATKTKQFTLFRKWGE